MKVDELKKLYESNKDEEGAVNFEEFNKNINSHVDSVVESKKPDTDKMKSDMQEMVISEYITSVGIEGVGTPDEFNVYAKRLGGSTTDLTEQNKTLGIQLKEANAKIEVFGTTVSNLTDKVSTYEESDAVTSKGFDAKYKNGIIAEAKSRVTDELSFTDALENVKTDFPEWVVKTNMGGKTPNGQGGSDIGKDTPKKPRNYKNWNQ